MPTCRNDPRFSSLRAIGGPDRQKITLYVNYLGGPRCGRFCTIKDKIGNKGGLRYALPRPHTVHDSIYQVSYCFPSQWNIITKKEKISKYGLGKCGSMA